MAPGGAPSLSHYSEAYLYLDPVVNISSYFPLSLSWPKLFFLVLLRESLLIETRKVNVVFTGNDLGLGSFQFWQFDQLLMIVVAIVVVKVILMWVMEIVIWVMVIVKLLVVMVWWCDGDGVVNVSHGDCGDDHAACGDGVVVILSNQRRPWTPPVIWRHPRI